MPTKHERQPGQPLIFRIVVPSRAACERSGDRVDFGGEGVSTGVREGGVGPEADADRSSAGPCRYNQRTR